MILGIRTPEKDVMKGSIPHFGELPTCRKSLVGTGEQTRVPDPRGAR